MELASVYYTFLAVMTVMAVVVFVALFFVDAGYGKFQTKKWGPSIPSRIGWVLMESPVFILMAVFFALSDRTSNIAVIVMFSLFMLHYFQRSFIFPFLIKGNKTMPLSIVAMGVLFNVLNALMQAGWLFYVSPPDHYATSWLASPEFVIGTVIFLAGFVINVHSDHVIRTLRKPGDTSYHFPDRGMYRYVCSANYFGECIEWLGFACLTWSWSGLVFFVWTFANLAPRALRIRRHYRERFPEAFARTEPKAIIPFVF